MDSRSAGDTGRFCQVITQTCVDNTTRLRSRIGLKLIESEHRNTLSATQSATHQGIEQKIPETSSGVLEKRRKGKVIAFPGLNGLHHGYRLSRQTQHQQVRMTFIANTGENLEQTSAGARRCLGPA
jgi:hypothetical protein